MGSMVLIAIFMSGFPYLVPLVYGYDVTAPGLNRPEPPKFVENPTWPDRSYYDEDGPAIVLNCRLTNISYTLLWYKNGQPLDVVKNQLLLQDQNQTLVFEDPKQFQSGVYKCLAYNIAGNVSHSGDILITERKQETRPRIIQTEPVNTVKHAKIGDTVNISCTYDVGGSIEALMDLDVEWFKGQQSVNDTSHTTYGLNNTFTNNKISSLNIDKLQESDYGTYMCYGVNSKGNDSRLISVEPPEHKLKHLSLSLIIGCSTAGVVAMVTMVVIVIAVRHRRYKIQKQYEELEWPDPDFSQYEVPDRKIEYDVFVSYSSEDITWVKDVLFEKLCQQGYNVCIDFKDFTPGVAVAENIMDAIYKSRKTIVLMSENFLKSMWGQFELQQAHNRAILQRTDVLILIKHDNSKVPGKLLGKTFLDWSDLKVQPHFWSRLFEAIGEPGKYTETGDTFQDTDSINRKLSEAIQETETPEDLKEVENRHKDGKTGEEINNISEGDQNDYAKFVNLDENENTDFTVDIKGDGTYANRTDNRIVNNGDVIGRSDKMIDIQGVNYDEVFIDDMNKQEDFYKDTDIIITI
ncbi:interleukin-1 receptor accessory protein-like 1-B [Ruditapes philippinarum]|uniref:interleukin-1 receptor accessory protein-like 1-B n=1 Tax=Ruditapes philippinarum TaxID=129788 RepID=UPI00295C2694|nr:interleukin-1 receptor accessory protein-like 1-B [Ruditapes philippinarum]XP_060571445.1 interleukin-1 receptor accessory protein-like 1-B [Ruditapes philippinarum]